MAGETIQKDGHRGAATMTARCRVATDQTVAEPLMVQLQDALGFLVAGPLTGLPSKLDAAVPGRCRSAEDVGSTRTTADSVPTNYA